eukprot:1195059-Prorocentrum_minimum.AAC.4
MAAAGGGPAAPSERARDPAASEPSDSPAPHRSGGELDSAGRGGAGAPLDPLQGSGGLSP